MTRSLAGPVTAVSVLLLVLGVSGAWYTHRLQMKTTEVLDHNVGSIRAAEELELLVREMRSELNGFLLTNDFEHVTNAMESREQVERWLELAVQRAISAPEKAYVARVAAGLNQFFAELPGPEKFASHSEVRQTIESLVQRLTKDVLPNARQYLDINEQELETANEQQQAMAGRLAMALLLLGTCGSVAGVIAGYGVTRGVRRSILQLSVPIQDVAGKLNEVVGPISVSADAGLQDLESVLQNVAVEVGGVIDKLHQSQREVLRAEQLAAVGQLAAGLAHELRNPLMCIKLLVQSARPARNGWLSLARSGAMDGPDHANHQRPPLPENNGGLTSRDIEVLDEEIHRMEALLDGFLDFARPARPEKRRIDLRQLVDQTLHVLSARAQRQGAALGCVAPKTPVWLEADEGQIRQVLLNLVLNALQAVDHSGTIQVEIETVNDAGPLRERGHRRRTASAPAFFANGAAGPARGDSGRPGVVLRVLDDGRGLPAAHGPRLFEPFFSTRETGLGLGLAVCHRIIEAHGGCISAANRAGRGSVFTVWLPATAV
jgi:two-component system, NtrC family, sensor histidine kinase HydH